MVAIDLSGFGYTQRPAARASYTREAQAQLVLGTLDALGIDRAHIVGHSYGGGITLYLASQHPERFRTMVLVDSSAPLGAAASAVRPPERRHRHSPRFNRANPSMPLPSEDRPSAVRSGYFPPCHPRTLNFTNSP